MKYNNLTWEENGLWYGWQFNEKLNRYYFDDIGHESMMDQWEYFWNKEDNDQKDQM